MSFQRAFGKIDESSIAESLTLYKVVDTTMNLPVMLHWGGAASLVMTYQPLNDSSFSEREYDEIALKLQQMVESFPDNDVTVSFGRHKRRAWNPVDWSELPEFLKPRAQYFNVLSERNEVFVYEYTISILSASRVKSSVTSFLNPKSIFGTFKSVFSSLTGSSSESIKSKADSEKDNFSGIRERIEQCFAVADSIKSTLNNLGLSPRLLATKAEYYEHTDKFTRPTKSHEWRRAFKDAEKKYGNDPLMKDIELAKYRPIAGIEESSSPREMLFSGVRAVSRVEDCTIDGKFIRVFTLDNLPNKEISGRDFTETVGGAPYEYSLYTTLSLRSHRETKGKYEKVQLLAGFELTKNVGSLMPDKTLAAHYRRVDAAHEAYAEQSSSSGERGVYLSVHLIVSIDEMAIEEERKKESRSRLEYSKKINTDIINNILVKFGGAEWACEPYAAWNMYVSLIPGFADFTSNLFKAPFALTNNVPYFLPMYDRSRVKNHNGVNHFFSPQKDLVVVDLDDRMMENWNWGFYGGSGSGKSFLINTFLTSILVKAAGKNKTNFPLIRIFDVGGIRGSFYKYMKLLGKRAEAINLSTAKKPRISLFDLVPDQSMPSAKKLDELCDYFSANTNSGTKENTVDKIKAYYESRISDPERPAAEIFEEFFDRLPKNEELSLFVLKPGQCLPSAQKMNFILSIIHLMLAGPDNASDPTLIGKDGLEESEVISLINEAYASNEDRFPKILDLYNIINSNFSGRDYKADGAIGFLTDSAGNEDREFSPEQDTDKKKILDKLRDWTRYGSRPMFDGDTDVNVNADVVLVDLKGLKTQPVLQTIYTVLFNELFEDSMYGIKDRPKYYIRDEMWEIIQNGRARKYLIECLRTARKHKIINIVCVQEPQALFNPDREQGQAMIGLMHGVIIGRIDESLAADASAALGIDPEVGLDLLPRMGRQIGSNEYGEDVVTHSRYLMALKSGHKNLSGKPELYVIDNLVHPFEYLLYSSSSEDNNIIDYYMKETRQFKELLPLLKFYAANKHIGDTGLIDFLRKRGDSGLADSLEFKMKENNKNSA